MMIAEYGQIKGQAQQVRTVLKSATVGKRTYELTHCSTGWTCAGSMARLVEEETWAILFYCDGALNGRHFLTLAEAESMFAKWTARE